MMTQFPLFIYGNGVTKSFQFKLIQNHKKTLPSWTSRHELSSGINFIKIWFSDHNLWSFKVFPNKTLAMSMRVPPRSTCVVLHLIQWSMSPAMWNFPCHLSLWPTIEDVGVDLSTMKCVAHAYEAPTPT